MAIWEIDLLVRSAVVVQRRFALREQKGFNPADPFFSNVRFCPHPEGIAATVEARASTREPAMKAAFVFFGRMLDALSLTVNMPMYLSAAGVDRPNRPPPHRRVVEQQEVESAFAEVQRHRVAYPEVLRSLSWYRKALNSADAFDQFLSFWNVIEVICASSYRRVPGLDVARAAVGSKNQIWACFHALWPTQNHPVQDLLGSWLDTNQRLRNEVSHGVAEVTIDKVEEVAHRLDELHTVSGDFLRAWVDEMLPRLLPRTGAPATP